MASELAILQAQLDALLDDQSKLENSVLRVKTKNREEHENYRTIQHNQFMSARPHQPNSTPGPGDYNHAQPPPHMRRPTGGLIQPLPINSRSSSSSSATISSSTRGRSSHKRRGGGGEENSVGNGNRNVDEGSVIDYDAVSRAQHLIRARPVGMASFRRPSDPIVKAAAAATRSAANGGRATHGPTSVSLLTRACAVDRRSSSSSLLGGRVSRVVFRAAPNQPPPPAAAAAAASSGVTTATIVQLLKTSHGPCPLVLGDGSTTGTVSIGSRTVTRVQVCAFSLSLSERTLEVFEDAVC